MHTFILLFVTFLAVVSSVSGTGCPPGYTSNDQRTCYKLYTTPETKANAALQCATDGGFLSSNSNGFANSKVLSLGKNASLATGWLGIECPDGNPSTCVNDDGTTFGPYESFYPNNPSDVGDCIGMSLMGRSAGYWFSYECENTFPFVCEYPYGPVSTTPSSLTCPKGYNLFQGVCYKYVDQKMKRDDASTNCKKVSGGNLVTISNNQLDTYLRTVTNGTEYNSWIGLTCPIRKYNGDKSSCVWDDGTTFQYNSFYSGWPSSANGYDCVLYLSTYWYNDFICSDLWPSICQTPATNA